MKKLFAIALTALVFACNSGTSTTEDTDSTSLIDPGAVRNDVPMRTVDTTQNLMKDTGTIKDTMGRP